MAQPRSSLFCGVVIAGAAFVQCDGEIANETMPVIEFLGQILSVIQVVPTKFMKLIEFNGENDNICMFPLSAVACTFSITGNVIILPLQNCFSCFVNSTYVRGT